ncbi:MAG TPA: ATP-binding protein [Gaiellaceae bacterium]|nr:ATP-binding protein [Gaiellaceae bacterium]
MNPRTYLAAGLGAIGLYFALPWNSFAQTLVYDAIAASAAAAAVAGAFLFRPSARLPWFLFGTGLLAFAVGDVFFNLYAYVWHTDPPVPSVADALYLAGYPFLTAGLVLLVRRLRQEERRGGRTDAAMVIVACGLLQWVFVMQGLNVGSLGERIVALSYPAMDVVLLAALVFLALTPTWRTAAYRYLAGSIVLLIFADELYALAPNAYADTSWLDSAWLLSYVLWGFAALHPSMRELSEPAPAGGPRLSTLRLTMLGAALATAPAVLLWQAVRGSAISAVAIGVGACLLGALVLLRFAGIQRQLLVQNEHLRQADRLKDEFVALVSHDLRTPLTSITGYTELALEEDLGEDARGYLNVVTRNSERLLGLVDDLLFVARLQIGEVSIERSEVDLGDMLRGGVQSLEPRAVAKGVTLTCALDSAPVVRADRARLLQVVDNLVSNAVKFTPTGGRVHVSLGSDGETACVEVADTGIGIGAEDQAHLFERFFRAQSAVDRQVPGTGLGLYISRVIADAHDGSLTVRSELGRGSTFRLDVPLAA